MSRKEVDRLEVIQATASKQLYQSDAARQLGVECAANQAAGSWLSAGECPGAGLGTPQQTC